MNAREPMNYDALRLVLYSAVISDVLDSLGYPRQAMRPFVRPLDDAAVLFGPARTGLFMPRFNVEDGENPYEIEIEMIDDLNPEDIAVFACNGPTERITPWGELLTTAALQRGAAGFVSDGLVRDVKAIRKTGFPVFHGGIGPLDSKGRSKMMARDIPVECAGVETKAGDLIFGDVDGVVVIPRDIASDVVGEALAKIEGENTTRDEIKKGVLLGDVYRKYGVL
jgi:4-hydroxy-4-methyl-2-oxoglutarate aldolase